MLIDDFIGDKPVIVYDVHEANTFVVRYLKKFDDISLVKRHLEIADYLIETEKGTMAVERKRAGDFLTSIKDGRLFEQIENLVEYEDPRIILEGSIFTSVRNGRCYSVDSLGKPLNIKSTARSQPRTIWSTQHFVHPHALVSIFEKIQDMGVKIVSTGSAYDTADTLHFWATRSEKREYLSIRQKRKTFSDLDKQLFLISGLTGISTRRAQTLLGKFGTPMRVFNAFLEYSPKKFPVEGIGEKTASEIRRILTTNLLDVKPKRMVEYEFRERVEELRKILTHTEDDLRRKKVPTLKEILKKRGLKVSGTKEELIRRLLDDMSLEERVDVSLFIKKYEELLKTKTEFQNIPHDLRLMYEKFKRNAKK
jgi:ERCC4-type nuclease